VTPELSFRIPFLFIFLFGQAINLVARTFGCETETGIGDMVRMHVSVGVVIISDNKRGFCWGLGRLFPLFSCVCSSLD
jgi:hypothetical protein